MTQEDEVYIRFYFELPEYHLATLEELQERNSKSETKNRDYEFSAFNIRYPVNKFIMEHKFTPECCVRPIGVEPLINEITLPDEQEYIRNVNAYSSINDKNGCVMRFERTNPPLGIKYRLKWKPARKKEIGE